MAINSSRLLIPVFWSHKVNFILSDIVGVIASKYNYSKNSGLVSLFICLVWSDIPANSTSIYGSGLLNLSTSRAQTIPS